MGFWVAYGAGICGGALKEYEELGCVVQKLPLFGLYGGIPPAELPELPLVTLDEMGLKPSFGRLAGGVKTWPMDIGEGFEVLTDAKAGYLCMLERSGGGS